MLDDGAGRTRLQAVFDGHNDVLLRLWQHARAGADPVAEFREGKGRGHISLPKARAGGLAGGLCAIFVPSGSFALAKADAAGHYATPLAKPIFIVERVWLRRRKPSRPW